MIEIEQIQKRIIDVIKQSGMSQSDIARSIGVCQQAVSKYLKGSCLPSLDTLANLCKLLDVDANYILCQE